MISRKRVELFELGLVAALIGALWLAGALGSRDGRLVFDPAWIGAAFGGNATLERRVLRSWRAPRLFAAVLVGAALSTGGLILQGITRNPLADPYLLGISGGAGLGVVLLHSASSLAAQLHWWLVPLAAFVGALAAMVAVLVLARRGEGRLSILALILAGVVVNALCAAAMTLLLARFDPFRLRVTSTWLAGGIGFTPWTTLWGVGSLVLGVCLALRLVAHRLNAFALGYAADLVGVDARRLMRQAAIGASLLAALGVSLSGLLGFVGLVVPHAVRLLVGSDFRATLPLSALGGGLLVLVADTAARLLFSPEELPVGALTALVGCPVLLWQLRRQLEGPR